MRLAPFVCGDYLVGGPSDGTADRGRVRMQTMTGEELRARSQTVADFLKQLSNPLRLQALCLLLDGERSVSEMEAALEVKQSTLSQQLSDLRLSGLVTTRREGRSIIYSIADERVRAVMDTLQQQFCAPGNDGVP